MPRLARVVIPGVAHHVTQRGNRRQPVFFSDDDYKLYRDLAAEGCNRGGVEVLAWCLMPNHVHLLVVPGDADALRRALAETHRRYTAAINKREGWQGHLWQERFHSFPLDDAHLAAVVRYVELNPVRARLVKTPEAWRWSSVATRLNGQKDGLVARKAPPPLGVRGSWTEFLAQGLADSVAEAIRRHETTGRPLGSEAFVKRLEANSGRVLTVKHPGRPKQGSQSGTGR